MLQAQSLSKNSEIYEYRDSLFSTKIMLYLYSTGNERKCAIGLECVRIFMQFRIFINTVKEILQFIIVVLYVSYVLCTFFAFSRS